MRKITDKKITVIIDKLEAAKKIAEADISFHKSTISLVEMLKKGVESGFMTPEEASERFNKEYERRAAQMIKIDFP